MRAIAPFCSAQNDIITNVNSEVSHFLARILENGNRVLRIVVNDTVIPPIVVSTFFDRGLKNKL